VEAGLLPLSSIVGSLGHTSCLFHLWGEESALPGPWNLGTPFAVDRTFCLSQQDCGAWPSWKGGYQYLLFAYAITYNSENNSKRESITESQHKKHAQGQTFQLVSDNPIEVLPNYVPTSKKKT
jgi:hypothetical protein